MLATTAFKKERKKGKKERWKKGGKEGRCTNPHGNNLLREFYF